MDPYRAPMEPPPPPGDPMRTVLIVTGALAALGAAIVIAVGVSDARGAAQGDPAIASATPSASAKPVALDPTKDHVEAMKVSGFCQNGWCWEDPLPTGDDLRAVSARAKDVWIATSGYTRPSSMIHWDGTKFSITPTTKSITALGRIGDTTWATTRQGVLLRSNGATFEEVDAHNASPLTAIWSASDKDAWAVGASGTILHWDGTSWSAMHSPTKADLATVRGHAPDDVWTSGDGVIVHFDGRAWSVARTVTEGPKKKEIPRGGFCGNPAMAAARQNDQLRNIDGIMSFGPKDVWFSAHGERSLHFDGRAWSEVEQDTPEAIWAASPNDAWSVGRRIGRWDGKSWSFAPAQNGSEELVAIDGAAPNDVWAVGALGRIRHWDGAKWTALERWSGVKPNTFWSGDGVAWMGGSGGLARRDAAGWRHTDSPFSRDVNAVGGTRSTDVWAFAAFQNPQHWDGKSWSVVSMPNDHAAVFRIAAAADDDVWGFGALSLVHWDGKTWSDMSGGDFAVEDLWAPSKGRAYAVARPRDSHPTTAMNPYAYDKHVLVAWDGKKWTQLGETKANAVSGLAPDAPWVAGKTIDRLDHGKWLTVVDTARDELVFGNSKLVVAAVNDAWLVQNGHVKHWDGTELRTEDIPLDGANVFVGPHDLFAYNARGGVLHRAR